MKDKVLMVGVNPKGVGGVSSVVRSIIKSNIYDDMKYIHSSKSNSGFLVKAGVMIAAYFKFIFHVVFFRPKYIHIHTSSYISFKRKMFFLELSAFLKIKFIIHLHGGSFLRFYDESDDFLKSRIDHLMKRAFRVVFVSPQSEKETSLVFNNIKTAVVPNFIYPLSVEEYYKHRLCGNYEDKYLFFLGDISNEKGFPDAVAFTCELRKTYPNLILNCAGKLNKDVYDAVINKFDASNYVFYNGVVGGVVKKRLMQDALFLISPSKTESFGMSNLEAALIGLPVLAYSVGGVPSVITHNVNGFLVDVGDWEDFVESSIKLIGNSEKYREFIVKCYVDANERFSIDEIRHKYDSVYVS